ncbi:uncharacterized protein BYT42DRAFT_66281 [Radiomyces spectabilis]|uniref:uncharacterized protein n=1 Tax=Radiomyces spectabilis TaxID=64574 RepID=UPI00222088E1|nr:uncharacterized protein BYT42DRAFT_66281 [Radiomyces spectabilis]KAI8371390.1 hypothetical protein BYT42DRAFT_66281 [Radiomyces spectabilis]
MMKFESSLTPRYVSAPEIAGELSAIPCTRNSLLINLAIHLPDSEVIYFNEGADAETVFNSTKCTTLTAWFELNREDPAIRQYLYIEIPIIWGGNKRNRRWIHRQRRVQFKFLTSRSILTPKN